MMNDNDVSTHNPVAWKISWQTILILLWITGTVGFLAYMSVLWLQLHSNIKKHGKKPPKHVLALVEACKTDLGIKAGIEVSIQGWLNSPALCASLKPKLLIPASMLDKMDRQQLEFGIRHELTHYRRRDHLTHLLLALLRCVYWFNPVVWLAFRQIKTDMETACDVSVTARLENKDRTRYIHTMIDLSGDMGAQYILGMGLNNERKSMEKRVKGIFMKKRTKPSVRMVAVLLACVMTMVCFTTACQPTPENEIVGNKGEEYIQSMISGNDDSSSNSKLSYSAPESLDYSLDNQIEGVRTLVKVNADIMLPENSLPIVSVSPSDISYETVKNLLDLIQNGRLLYDMDTCAKVTFKSDVQRKIDRYQYELSMVKGDDESASFYREKLAELYVELEKAPTTVEEANEMLASGKIVSNVIRNTGSSGNPEEGESINNTRIEPFELTKDNYNAKFYNIIFGMGTDSPATLTLNTQYNSELPQIIEYQNTSLSSVVNIVNNLDIMTDFTLSADEAIKMAEPIANALSQNLSLFKVNAVVTSTKEGFAMPYGYNLIYTQNYNGVPANYASPHSKYLNASEEESQYNKEYPQEYLSIVIGVDGIYSITYSAPQTITKIESSKAQIKPFDEIKEIFNQHIVLAKNDYDTYISIDKVQLGLMRIAKPNSKDYLVIPVWDFYGNSIGATGNESHTDDEYWGMMANNPDRSFLTINAVDGSIINRNLGY
jgi:beta-lactamase regulating signal transducer with metallopeptidase domain